jgi:GNAT superfamily N-acetyltransferase
LVKNASVDDILIIENILSDVDCWMDSNNLLHWGKENIQWAVLSQNYRIDDFYIAYEEDIPVACMALIDFDPIFWPDIPKGKSLFLHKIAVKRDFASKGYSKELIDFAKEAAKLRNIQTIRLDCFQHNYKVRHIYEKQGFNLVEEKTVFGKYGTAFYACNVNKL